MKKGEELRERPKKEWIYVYMYVDNYDQFMLYARNQHNILKQFS